jgi:CBS domain-containing protein
MRRERRPTEAGEYQDPLKNYDPPVYADELERALCDESLAALTVTPFLVVGPTTPIVAAMQKMADLDVACLLVAQDDRLVGIFTERDVLDKVADRFAELRDQPVSEVMTKEPVVAHVTNTPAMALNQMAIGGFRHIPILDVDDRIVGVLGPRRVTDYIQKHVG